MKIKNIVTVLLITILLASCAPATTSSVPTIASTTSSPAPTENLPAPSATPSPTLAPTKTATARPTTEIKDYPDTMADFNATVNFEVVNIVDIQIAPNTFIRRWTPAMLDNGETVAIPTAIEFAWTLGSDINGSMFYILSDITRNTGRGPNPKRMADWVIDLDLQDLQGSPYAKGQQYLNFLTGDTANEIWHRQKPFSNPFAFLDGDLANRMITFAKSGGTDVSVLVNVSGIPYPVVYTFRIQGLAVVTTPVSP